MTAHKSQRIGHFWSRNSKKFTFLYNKADKSASNSLNPLIFEGLVTLCALDAVCFSRHIPNASSRILAERFALLEHYEVISYKVKNSLP